MQLISRAGFNGSRESHKIADIVKKNRRLTPQSITVKRYQHGYLSSSLVEIDPVEIAECCLLINEAFL